MKRLSILSMLILAFRFTLFSQDYKVTSVELLQNDMTARKTILTEKINGGQQCAVLRISTQNILDPQRDIFQFECDMGSVIRERRKDGGEICLWVSPGIKILKIKHSTLGNYILNIPEMLKGNIQSLNTYRISIVGLKELPQEVVTYGKCQMVFLPYPKDATLFINGDSIGTGTHSITSLSGNYQWTMKHPLYHSAEGTVSLTSGQIDTIHVNLNPAYGYMKIVKAYDMEESPDYEVYVDGQPKGKVPYTSEKMTPGTYDVALRTGDSLVASTQIEIKEHFVSVNNASEMCSTYARLHNSNVNQEAIDTSFQVKRTRHYPIRGKVAISATPEATVTIDGIAYGRTPITVDSLSIGAHQLELSAELHTTLKCEINVEEEFETTYFLRLKRSCVATILTDMPGDQVYMDMNFIGKTPVTLEKPFGTYPIYIVRPGHFGKEEEITLSPDNLEPVFEFPFGQTVNVETGDRNAKLYLDGEYMGRAPQQLYIYNGAHTLRAEYGWTAGEQDIDVSRDYQISDLRIVPQMQSPSSFLKNGAFFFTGNLGFVNKGGKIAYGFNIGDIAKGGRAGWYFNIMTNSDFIGQLFRKDYSVLNAYLVANENNTATDSQQDSYQDERPLIRASALFGVTVKVAGPVYLRVGGGYGIRREALKNSYDSWVINDPVSWNSFESSLGVQCCIYNIVFNTDVLIPVVEVFSSNKKLVEFRVGLGFCLKHKR